MEAIIKKAFAIYNSNDQGYSYGPPVAIYPFKAAAAQSLECKQLGGYDLIFEVKLICFEDLCYIYEYTIPSESCFGKFRLGLVETAYRLDTKDKTYYIKGDDVLLNIIRKAESKMSIENNIYLIQDSKITYCLRMPEPVTIKPFALSRELAVANAMDKLTEEEKKLLGLK